jgi:hypothetical protein
MYDRRESGWRGADSGPSCEQGHVGMARIDGLRDLEPRGRSADPPVALGFHDDRSRGDLRRTGDAEGPLSR